MSHVISRDGTTIAYDKTGTGPAVLLVNGAMGYREYFSDRPLAAELAKDFTAITYDRRGRGESTDTPPYAVEREIDDIEALIDAAGGSVYLYGFSSGAVLALKAAAKLGDQVAKLALHGHRSTWESRRRGNLPATRSGWTSCWRRTNAAMRPPSSWLT